MFKAIANMAGVLVVLCFIIFLAGVVVNQNRVTKDEAAQKAKEDAPSETSDRKTLHATWRVDQQDEQNNAEAEPPPIYQHK